MERIAVGIAADLAAALDPVVMLRGTGMEPDPWQADVLRSGNSRLLLNVSRQAGKSTISAALATHTALYDPGSLTLILSPSQRQSSETFRKALDVYRGLGKPTAPEAESALRIELENGSRIVALPGKEATIRGLSGVRLLIVDEASRVPDNLYHSVLPMLAVSGGRLVAMSTPFGRRGWWFESWEYGGPGWERIEIPASLCPRIPAEFLAEARERMGDYFYRQEFECQFMDAESSAFREEDIRSAFGEEYETWSL